MRKFRGLVLGLGLVSLAGSNFAAVDHKTVENISDLLVLECSGLSTSAIEHEPRVYVAFDRANILLASVMTGSVLSWRKQFIEKTARLYSLMPSIGLTGITASINRQSGRATIDNFSYECRASSLAEIDDWVNENVAPPIF
tara:strand:- start:1163 stop:1585 length:423 start_codon:yes stop_codon:yes gene_type:complete